MRSKILGRKEGVVITLRKIVKVGDSFYVSIPKEWLEKHDLKERDVVLLMADEIIKIIPAGGKVEEIG